MEAEVLADSLAGAGLSLESVGRAGRGLGCCDAPLRVQGPKRRAAGSKKNGRFQESELP